MKASSTYNPPFLLKFALLAALVLVEAIHLRSNGQRNAFQTSDRSILDTGTATQQTVNQPATQAALARPTIN